MFFRASMFYFRPKNKLRVPACEGRGAVRLGIIVTIYIYLLKLHIIFLDTAQLYHRNTEKRRNI